MKPFPEAARRIRALANEAWDIGKLLQTGNHDGAVGDAVRDLKQAAEKLHTLASTFEEPKEVHRCISTGSNATCTQLRGAHMLVNSGPARIAVSFCPFCGTSANDH